MVLVTLVRDYRTKARIKYSDTKGANPPGSFVYLSDKDFPKGKVPKHVHIVWDDDLEPKFR